MICLKYTGKIPEHYVRYGRKGYLFVTLKDGSQILPLEDDQTDLFSALLTYRSSLVPLIPSKEQIKELSDALEERVKAAAALAKAEAERQLASKIAVAREAIRVKKEELKGLVEEAKGAEVELGILIADLQKLVPETEKPKAAPRKKAKKEGNKESTEAKGN